MAKAGSVIVRIEADDSRYRKTITGLGNATRAAVRGLTVAGTVISAAWTAVGLTSVKYNAQIEQLETSFRTMTGSAEKATQIMERLRKLGASTPFATEDLAAATQLLMQYGMDADVAIDRMTMLGDISQGNAEKLNRITMAYGQMTSAGKVYLQDVKQMIEAGFNPLQEISEKTGESMDSLYDRISKGTLSVQEITDAMRSATSEGGKFFGAMEQQSKTVTGLLSTLKDELRTLGGDIFEPVSDSLRTQLLPEAINLVREMQDAYGKRGMDGLIDSVTDEIPKLLKAASGALEKVAAKLKDKLPGIIKKLVSVLPDLLASAGDSILPTLVDTFFQIIAVAVEEITARLPELAPILLRGIGNLFKSVFTGLWNVTEGFFDGFEKAMKKMGLLSLTPLEAFEQAWEATETSQYKTIEVELGVEINPENYEADIDAALNNVRTALENIPELSEEQKNAIETAIINGTGIELINQTLTDMGVPETKAAEVAKAITDARDTIQTTLEGLGLSQAAIDNIAAVAESGGDVQAALEKYNIDPTTAAATAATIDNAYGGIETAVTGLGLTDTQIAALYQSTWDDKSAIIAALLMMGVDPSVIDPVVASYDTLTGSLTASAKSIFQQIYEEFTNGIPESDEDVQKAKDAVTGLFTQAYKAVEQWRQDAIKDLELSGLTGEALDTAIADVNTEAQGMIDELNRLEKEAMAWTEENANKSTAFVQSNLDQLDAIVAQLSDINARIDVLTNDQFNAARSRRQLVIAGAVTNVEHQVEAFALTQAELAQRIEEAEIAAGEAFEKAAEDFAGDAEGYAAREKEILDQLANDKQAAYDVYNAENASIIAGIVKASPDLQSAILQYADKQQLADMATTLRTSIMDAINKAAMTGEAIDPNVFFENIKAEGVDIDAIAEALKIDPVELAGQITAALKSTDGDTELNAALVDYVDGVEGNLSAALSKAGIDPNAIPGIKLAIEEGYLTAAGDIDWTNLETILTTMLNTTISNSATGLTDMSGTVTAAAESAASGVPGAMDKSSQTYHSGANVAKGFARGIKANKQLAIAAAKSMALDAVSTINRTLQIKSPSRLTAESGKFFGQGFALGIRDEISTARSAAQSMASSALNALDSIGGRISIGQQVGAGSMANAFQNMLGAMNLATDSGQTIQLYLNGRMVAEAIRSDTRATQAAFNTELAMGVGKR